MAGVACVFASCREGTMASSGRRALYKECRDMAVAHCTRYSVPAAHESAAGAAARMATVAALLHMNLEHVFTGFYLVDDTVAAKEGDGKEGEEARRLLLGPYQGDLLACAAIQWGKGVCGECAAKGETQVVDDVTKIDNYIACDDETKSEVVVPVYVPDAAAEGGRRLFAVLDIDSEVVGHFGDVDREELETICEALFMKA